MRQKIKSSIYGLRKKTRKIYDRFDRKDVAQMFTSVFVILQVIVIPIINFEINQSILLAVLSIVICGVIIWIIGRDDFLKHLVVGIIIVGILSFLIGFILNASLEKILVTFAIGLPVATTVNALKE